jgi:hypothetical protein
MLQFFKISFSAKIISLNICFETETIETKIEKQDRFENYDTLWLN